MRPLLHPSQPQRGDRRRAHSKPDSLVFDLHPKHGAIGPQAHSRVLDTRVTGNVGQRLLDDAIRGRLHIRCKASVQAAVFEGHLNIGLGSTSLEEPQEGRQQSQIV